METEEPEVVTNGTGDAVGTTTLSLPSKMTSNEIRPIEKNVVHRICSGQVIVTLGTAVKELVENSIDAGCTSVDIRLMDYGTKLIEVSDNGIGIEEKNFQGLGLKHHTSKLNEFEDLSSIATFGFRGEALSSLCALAGSLTVTTKSDNSKQAYKIEFDTNGRIESKSTVARSRGTTVSLRNLFSTLPVRHKEFIKNIKKEFNKMISILYGYSILAKGVRISCSNQVERGGTTTLFSVPASNSMRERISSIFGSKMLLSLLELDEIDDVDSKILEQYNLDYRTFDIRRFKIEGFISKPNSGRSSGDRQFFFINARPCEPIKIVKLVNEVYGGFSRGQTPFVCLDIRTDQESLDVNVTPDKRMIYLQNEKMLYALIKATLVSNLSTASSSLSNMRTGSEELLSFSSSSKMKEVTPNSTAASRLDSIGMNSIIPGTRRPRSFRSSSDNTSLFDRQCSGRPYTQPRTDIRSVLQKYDKGGEHSSNSRTINPSTITPQSPLVVLSSPYKSPTSMKTGATKQPKLMDFLRSNKRKFTHDRSFIEEINLETDEDVQIIIDDNIIDSSTTGSQESTQSSSMSSTEVNLDEEVLEMHDALNESYDDSTLTSSMVNHNNDSSFFEDTLVSCDDDSDTDSGHSGVITTYSQLKTVSVRVDWDNVKERLGSGELYEFEEFERNGRKFMAQIQPGQNRNAEKELSKQIDKHTFNEMRVIGQFNKGFIVSQHGPDLFIIDQHASDEKFNFENLQKSTILQGQRLIIPLQLELPALSENILIDNLDTFQKNGFYFDINTQGPPTKRIQLTKIPYSRSCQFGKEDLEELIFMLQDGPSSTTGSSLCRPSRVRSMFASRACRKSVMIGTKLSPKDMKLIVNNMGLMEQPWNCPHGRPTIRHLLNIHLLPDAHLINFNHS